MEIKYEAVFGDQALFDNAIGDSVAAINHGDVVFCFNSYNAFLIEVMKCNDLPLSDIPEFAMRRIIPEPKHWTWEDKKAGALPELGALVFDPGNNVGSFVGAGIHEGCSVFFLRYEADRCEFWLAESCKPVETLEEKERRLRSEWCNRAMDYSTIQQLYDAMLSGELAVSVAPEQNK